MSNVLLIMQYYMRFKNSKRVAAKEDIMDENINSFCQVWYAVCMDQKSNVTNSTWFINVYIILKQKLTDVSCWGEN